MTFEDWQAWLESQFVDDDEPATTTYPAQIAPEQPTTKSPAILRLRDDLPPPPPGVTYATEPSPYVQEAIVPPAAREFVAPPPIAYQTPVPEPQPTPQPAAAEETDVPSIEQYLPFLRQSAEPVEHAMVPPRQPTSPKVEDSPAALAQPELLVPEPGEAEPLKVETEDVIGAQLDAEQEPPREVHTSSSVVNETIIAEIETIEVKYTLEAEEAGDESLDTPDPLPESLEPEPRTDASDMIAMAEEAIRSEARDAERRSAAAQRHRSGPALDVASPMSSDKLWSLTPRSNPAVIAQSGPSEVANSDAKRASEARLELVSRLLDPNHPLAETARLMNVEPVAVQRRPNPTVLVNMRPAGETKRYKLADVIGFLEQQSRNMTKGTGQPGAQ